MPQARRGATLRDIAEEAGLSVAAVSYALRGKQTSAHTQSRVREIADRLGYRADPIARALASGRSGTVGVVIGNLVDDLWMQRVAAGIGNALLDRGLYAFLVDAGTDVEQEQTLAHQLVDQRVDALVVSPTAPGAKGWAELARRVPVITVGDSLVGAPTAGEVLFDNQAGVSMVLQHLADCGHRHIVLMTAGRRPTTGRPAEGFAAGEAERLGLTLHVVSTDPDLSASAAAIEKVLVSGPSPPTAVVGMSDSLAHGCYAAAQQMGWSIPERLSVMGYDDQPVSAILDPPLTTVGWNEQLLTEGVGNAVEAAIVAASRRVGAPTRKHGGRLLLTPTLLVRDSVATLPGRRRRR